MLKQIFAILFTLIGTLVLGQGTFTLIISTSADERPGDIIELPDHSFILSSGFFSSSVYLTSQRFFKINSSGTIIKDAVYDNPNGIATLSGMLYINDTNIFCIGEWVNSGEKNQIWVAGIDSGLSILWNKKYQTNYNYMFGWSMFVDDEGTIIFGTSLYDVPPKYYLYLQEFTQHGELLKSKMDSSVLAPLLFDMIEFPAINHYLAAVTGYGQNTPGQLLVIDSSFTITGINPIPNYISNCFALKNNNYLHYYLSGNKVINQSYDYAIMKMSVGNLCQKISILQNPDTMDWGGLIQSMDFIFPDTVFVGGTLNFAFFGPYCNQNSWFALSSFDSALNLRWTKYYGGDAYYQLTSVVATKDGGAIMVGTRYDYPSQTNQCDLYVVKVNNDGILTDNNINPARKAHDVVVFPNPGSDCLIIESGPQVNGALFRMTTLDGKMVINKIINERKMAVNTFSFSDGTYIWQILFNNKVIETGKWVKL